MPDSSNPGVDPVAPAPAQKPAQAAVTLKPDVDALKAEIEALEAAEPEARPVIEEGEDIAHYIDRVREWQVKDTRTGD